MIPNTNAYLQTWAQEIDARSNRVRHLIGSAHWPSDGFHKEAILREFLERHLSSALVVSHGFVRCADTTQACSPEIDVLICDPATHPPLFAEGGLHIVAPSSTVAHISVKTQFDLGTLRGSLINAMQTQMTVARHADASRVWAGLLFFEIADSRTTESILRTLKMGLTDAVEALKDQASECGVEMGYLLPKCVATIEGFLAFLSLNDCLIRIRLFDVKNLSFACAFADLFSAVRQWHGNTKAGEIEQTIEQLDAMAPHVDELALPK